jgi:hypothetical protein
LAVTPDGEYLVSSGGRAEGKASNHTICLWRTTTGELLRCWEAGYFYQPALAMSSDGKSVAVAKDSSLSLFELATGGERAAFTGHLGPVSAVAFAPNGRSVVTGSGDSTLLIWDLTDRAGKAQKDVAPRLSASQLKGLWTDLADGDAARAYRAACTLAAARTQSIPFLAEHLPPARRGPSREQIEPLVRELDADSFAEREKAMKELGRLGEPAAPALRQVLAGKPSLEVRRRIDDLLAALERQPGLRAARAIEMLERIGTPEARHVLMSLTGGAPEARLTRLAKAAVERLERTAE